MGSRQYANNITYDPSVVEKVGLCVLKRPCNELVVLFAPMRNHVPQLAGRHEVRGVDAKAVELSCVKRTSLGGGSMAIVSFANMKGGVAKTTLAVNLAYTLATRFAKRVLLIDMDPQFNATQCFLAGERYEELLNRGQKTIRNLFDDPNDLVPNVVTGCMRESYPLDPASLVYRFCPNLDLVLGDLNLYRVEISAGSGRERLLSRYICDNQLDSAYDYILIDCPPTPSVWMVSALLASQYYLIPVKPEPLSTVGLDLFRGWLNRVIINNHGHNVRCAGVVLTIAELNTKVYRDTRAYFEENEVWRDKIFNYVLEKRTAIARAQQEQRFMLDLDDDVKRCIVNLSQEFLRRFEDESALEG